MSSQHKHPPKAVRMPGGLLTWFVDRARETGQPVNAVLVAALEAFRQASEDGATAPAAARDLVKDASVRLVAGVAELTRERSHDQRRPKTPGKDAQ